jgi:hypothetical protein
MKKLTFLFLIISITVAKSFAQDPYLVTEKSSSMSLGIYNAYSVQIQNYQLSDAMSDFKKWCKNSNAAKTSTTKNEFYAERAFIKDLNGNNTVNVYATFAQDKGQPVTMNIFFNLGAGWVSTSQFPDQSAVARKWVRDFAISEARSYMKSIVTGETKKLNNLNDDLSDLKTDMKNRNSDIQNYLQKIVAAKNQIASDSASIVQKTADAQTQTQKVTDLNTQLNGIQ